MKSLSFDSAFFFFQKKLKKNQNFSSSLHSIPLRLLFCESVFVIQEEEEEEEEEEA